MPWSTTACRAWCSCSPIAAKHQFTMRRVQVTHRFERTVFVRSTPIPKEEQLTAQEAEEGLLPKEPLRPGERVLSGRGGGTQSALCSTSSRDRGQADRPPRQGENAIGA